MTTKKYFTKLDDTNFPIVKITLGNNINKDEFEDIKKFWLKQYLNEKNYIIIFDTLYINKISISYLHKLGKFVRKLKKLQNQYLKASILLIKSDFVKKLYSIYSKIQKPISKIYIVKEETDVNIIILKLQNNEKIIGYTECNP